MGNNNNGKGSGWLIIAAIIFGIWLLGSCGSDDGYTASDLRNAQERRANGEKLNREDTIMLEGYDEWKAEQDKYADYWLGIYLYFHYKEIERYLKENNPYRKGKNK